MFGTHDLALFVVSGILLNLTPGQDTVYKVALFFLAFLPQFVDPTAELRVISFLFLGGLFIFTGTLWCLALVWTATALSRRLRTRGSSQLLLKRATGAVLSVWA